MTYLYKIIDDTYVVWFAPANRYMHLQEPAFRVLRDWDKGLPEEQIIWNCEKEYELSQEAAANFVQEVIGQLKKLSSNYREEQITVPCPETCPPPDAIPFKVKTYQINGSLFQFRYGDPYLEEQIHPGFASLEVKSPHRAASHLFELFSLGDKFILRTDGKNCWKCPDKKTDYYIGQVYMQLLNGINNTTNDHWMGAVHASSISTGTGAVLFTAHSGSGKSTFAAVLLKLGYHVFSDDFSPISLNNPQVYSFPEGISVKNPSLQVLQPYYPELVDSGESLSDHVHEVFIPISEGELPKPEPVKAIVFLQYNQEVELQFKPIANLQAMDRFLQQLWLPTTGKVAKQFMDWFFQIPCYTLTYSNTIKAISSVTKLFQ